MKTDGYGGIGVVIPNRFAMEMTLLAPTAMPVRIAAKLRD